MAKLTIEIDTGKLDKIINNGPEARERDVRTIHNLTEILHEATNRLEKMGRGAAGVVLYDRRGQCGRITLMESDLRKGKPRNWYDDTVSAGVPLSERRNVPKDVVVFQKGNPNHCGNWYWKNIGTNTISGPFASPDDAATHATQNE